MKKVLFVPGFKEGLTDRDYESVINTIQNQGYDVEFVAIDWNRTIIDDWVSQLEAAYNQYDSKNVILAGFSYGAYITFVAASHRSPSALWLFSLSPYFAEDIPKLKKSWLKAIGHRRADSFQKISFDQLAKKINCETLIVSGDKENKKYPVLYERLKAANAAIRNSSYVIAKNSGHDIAAAGYMQTIKENI